MRPLTEVCGFFELHKMHTFGTSNCESEFFSPSDWTWWLDYCCLFVGDYQYIHLTLSLNPVNSPDNCLQSKI